MAEPIMDSVESCNTYGVHTYHVRVVFGATTTFTARSREVTVARPTSTTMTLTLPKAYAEIVKFNVGRKAAAAVAGLEWVITTNAVDTTGVITLTSIESDTGAATAPATGDIAYIELGVSSDTLNDRFTSSG
jgi:hypothetical protein